VSDATTPPEAAGRAGGTGSEPRGGETASERERPAAAVPTRAVPGLSTVLAVLLGALAVAFLAAASIVAGAAGLLALALLIAAVSLVSRRLCRIAGATFVVAFLAAGVTPATPAPLVGGAILAVTAWTVADHGLGLAAHVGREAGTARNELVHAAASLLVGAAAGAVAYGATLLVGGGQPVTALGFLLFGGVVILVALRE
jgi:hypothetical protein